MTGQDTDLSPADMAQLRAEFRRMGMSQVQAAEAAAILARLGAKLDRLGAETQGVLATLTRIEARLAAMAEGDRRPRG
jgi:hypothetical protein